MILQRLFLFVLITALVGSLAAGAVHTINTSGFGFAPSNLSVTVGDTGRFVLESIHNAVEVSQATWQANGFTPLSGGFSVGFGGGTVVFSHGGTHYYVCQPHSSFGMKGIITVDTTTATSVDEGNNVPPKFDLLQNYPNPFNPSTDIMFKLATGSTVTLKVYGIDGDEIATLIDNQHIDAGTHTVHFNAAYMSTGVYIYRISAGRFERGRKMVFLK